MLDQLLLGNFIHFKERHDLRFKKGLNILLGPNHSGKTSVFEAVRRCMSVSKNSGLSNPHDTNKIAYVTCKFDNQNCTIYSSVITVPAFERVVTLKAVKRTRGTQEEKAVDILRHVEHKLENEELQAENFAFESLLEDGDEKFEESVIKYLEDVGRDKVEEFYSRPKEETDKVDTFYSTPPDEKKNTKCEEILKESVDEEAVIIFPFRSFSPYQWTKSKRDMTSLAGEISDEIGLKKEVVFWYLNQQPGKISEETRELERKYFNFITGNCGFEFELVDGKRVGVRNVHFASTSPSTENLLKIPEGIYEAKSAAIILAVPQFRTICLDDAERGMHPQMIERLRDLVLQDINDKVVLVITHHPAFLAPWNISRTFFFQRRRDSESYKFVVKPLANQIKGKGPQIITSGQFSSLFFAERICWVEGKTEYLFFTALKYEIFRNSKVLGEYCKEGEAQQKRFRDFLSTLHIVSMDGEANKVFFREISLELGLDHFFILDFDALHKNLPGGEDNPPTKLCGKELDFQKIISNFCRIFKVKVGDFKGINTMELVVKTLQRHRIFAWKLTNNCNISTGAIEDAVNGMCKKPENKLSKYLEERNMKLKQKKKRGVVKGFEKLFKDKNITNENITEVVRQILDLSKNDKSSDFNRLMAFFITTCEEKLVDYRARPKRKRSIDELQDQQSPVKDSQLVAKKPNTS